MAAERPQGFYLADRMAQAERAEVVDHHVRVIESMGPFVGTQLDKITPVEKIWQPSKHIITPEQVDKLSDGAIAVHLGHAITEAGIATFETGINRFKGIGDPTGTDQGSWSKFSRWWTGEEDRHKVVYDRMILSAGIAGRVVLREYEKTVQSFIRNGMEVSSQLGNDDFDPYEFVFFAGLQEGNTVIATVNAGEIARKEGALAIFDLDRDVASDEERHDNIYKPIGSEIFRLDPDGGVVSLNRTLSHRRGGITMPASLMTSGEDASEGSTELFKNLVRVEIAMGGFTPSDYVNVFEDHMKFWRIDKLNLKSREAEEARENIYNMGKINKRMANIVESRRDSGVVKLPWIQNPIELPRVA